MNKNLLSILSQMKFRLVSIVILLGMGVNGYASAIYYSDRIIDGIRYLVPIYLNDAYYVPEYYGFKDGYAPDGRPYVPTFETGRLGYGWLYAYVKNLNDPLNPDTNGYNWVFDPMLRNHPYYRGEIWIPDSVYIEPGHGSKYKQWLYVLDMGENAFNEVTSIRTPVYGRIHKNTFRDCIYMKKAQIGASYMVNDSAFQNCAVLDTVIFEKSPIVEKAIFYGCKNIRTVVLQWPLPKLADESVFEPEVYEQATLYVRPDQMEACLNDEVWSKFSNIRTIDNYHSGIDDIKADQQTQPCCVYNLSGVLLRSVNSGSDWRSDLPSGIYIVRDSDGTVRKEYIH